MLEVVLLVGFSGCSLPGRKKAERPLPPAFYSSAATVCRLLLRDDLEGILGHRYSQGVGEVNPDFLAIPGISTCSYERTKKSRRFPKVYVGVAYAYPDQIFRDHRRFLEAVERATAVKGVGEKAVWDPVLYQLFVLAKGNVLAFQSFPDLEPERDHLIRARRLAIKAIDRMR